MKVNFSRIFCITVILAIISFRLLYQFGPYFAGRRGHDEFSRMFGNTWVVTLGLIAGIGILAVIALCLVWLVQFFTNQIPRQKGFKELIATISLVAATFIFCLGTLRPANHYFLVGFKIFINNKANFPAIQDWSRSLMPPLGPISKNLWPQNIIELAPEFVILNVNDGNRYVSLTWGGGGFHWGLIVRENPGGFIENPICLIIVLNDVSYIWADSQ